MNSALRDFLHSWPYDPWLIGILLASGLVYTRGWLRLKRQNPERWNLVKLAAYWSGLGALLAALASPIEVFASLLLFVHMLQHMLLLIVAPPLLWWAAPMMPLLRGLPRVLRRAIAPVLRSPATRDIFSTLTRPWVAWTLMVATVWLWHTPRGYGLALADPSWHVVEHLTFIAAALLFWYPVMTPYPARAIMSRWILLPYLILADVQNTLLAAWLTFASQPIYAHYAEVPRVGGWTPLADQQLAGVLMWVPGSIAFLLPVCVLAWRMLSADSPSPHRQRRAAVNPTASLVLPVLSAAPRGAPGQSPTSSPAADLLRLPLLGRWMKARWFRPATQIAMLLLAAAVIVDGLFGPRVAAANLAGVAPWIHWRGLVMFGLLVGGNFFCMACPFTLPRSIASRWFAARWNWPRALRGKWLGLALVALFLWSYEAFSLWNSPWLTAWIAVGYFVAAFAVDSFFRGAAFCKYVCPIGQFNFVQSLVSPLHVTVRQPATCTQCTGQECLRGSEQVAGCGMHLFQPRKRGNLDCTFCLDCARACPHDNVGVLTTAPLLPLADTTGFRSGIGRLERRYDLAALVLLLVFGAFANAAGMIAPVVAWQDALQRRLGDIPLFYVTSAYYLLAIIVVPLALTALAAAASRRRDDGSLLQVVARYSYMLIPLGFAMWLAHHAFHFLTSYGTIVPVAQRMAIDTGLISLREPHWQHACCVEVADWIIQFELLVLGVGLLASLVVGYQIAQHHGGAGRALRTLMPWALLAILLFAAGVWIVLEPMQMRGTLPPGAW